MLVAVFIDGDYDEPGCVAIANCQLQEAFWAVLFFETPC